MAQVAEHLPNKCKALSSTPYTGKKKEKEILKILSSLKL
jgi:hypothetical protein